MIGNLKRNHNIIDNKMFLYDTKEGFKRNDHINKFYCHVFYKNGDIKFRDKIKVFNNCILINTQCLVENGITDGKTDLKLYKEAIEILKNYNSNIVIKPHPRELIPQKYMEFGCTLYMDNDKSQEVILANLENNPKAIISISSSTLLNASILFEIPVISLAKIMKNYEISYELKRELDDYIRQYKNTILFPGDFNELGEIIKEL